jgi:hypothetical protein
MSIWEALMCGKPPGMGGFREISTQTGESEWQARSRWRGAGGAEPVARSRWRGSGGVDPVARSRWRGSGGATSIRFRSVRMRRMALAGPGRQHEHQERIAEGSYRVSLIRREVRKQTGATGHRLAVG